MKHFGLTRSTGWSLFFGYLRKNAVAFGIMLLILACAAAGYFVIFRFAHTFNGRFLLTLLLSSLAIYLLLTCILSTQKYSEYRVEIAESTINSDQLIELATRDNQYSIREAAVKRLDDSKCLTEIALNDPDSRVRKAAASRIDDPVSIEKILRESKDSWIVFYLLRSIKKIVPERKAGIPLETGLAMRDFAAQHNLLEKLICRECFGIVETRDETTHCVEYEYCSTDTVVIGYEGDVTSTYYYCASCGKDSFQDFSVTLASVLPEKVQ